MKNKVLQKSQSMITVMVAFLVVLMAFTGCHKSSKTSYLIPDDATIVVCADINNIWKKGELDNIDRLASFKFIRQEVKSESSNGAKIFDELIEDPNSCGLDILNDVFIFSAKSLKSPVVIGCQVKDADRFKEFLRNASKKLDFEIEFEDEKDYHFAFCKYEETAICWNSDKAYVMNSWKVNDAKSDADDLMNLKENNSLASNESATSFLSEDRDIRFYFDLKGIKDLLPRKTYRQLEPVLSQYENKDVAGCLSLNFEKGAISLQSKMVGAGADGNNYLADFNKDLLDYLPEKTYIAATYALDINKLIKELDKADGMDIDEEIYYGSSITIRDLLKCFSGSIAMNLSDFTTDRYGNIMPVMTIAADISNTRVIKQLLDEKLERDGDKYLIPDGDFCIKFNDDALIFTNDNPTLKAFSKGGTGNGIADIASDAKKGNYFYINLNLADYPSSVTKSIGKREANLIGDFFKNAEVKFLGDDNACEIRINLKDSKKNSLAGALEFIDDNLTQLGRIFN